MYSYKKLSDEEFHALLNTILAPGTTALASRGSLLRKTMKQAGMLLS